MYRYIRFLPLLALFAFGAVLMTWPRHADATPIAAPTWSGPGSNGLFTISASYTDDTPPGSGSAVLTAVGGAGVFLSGTALVTPADGEAVTVTSSSVTVGEDTDTVAETKTITVSFQCISSGTVFFTLSHGGTTSTSSAVLNCTTTSPFFPTFPTFPTYPTYPTYPTFPSYPFNPLGPIYNPLLPTVAAVPTALGISASPASLSCNGTSNISVTVRDASGNLMPVGTNVSLTASMGSITPTSGVTSGTGTVSAVYYAPNSSGSAVITATAGTATGQATVVVNCASQTIITQPSAPVSPPPVFVPQAPTGTGIILPPNTGDAGLAAGTGSSTALPVAIATALTVLIGGAAIGGWSWRRERNQAR